MNEATDAQLLREYAEQGDEAAFREIVARHAGVVYSSALRQVGSADLARDVAQSVFSDLARKARLLARSSQGDASLSGWLYRGTRFAALKQMRNERRRRARERQAMEYFDSTPESESDWGRVRPVLDEAMSALTEADRQALLLRFFRNCDFRAVGRALGTSDDAAQKRVSRALEKLRLLLTNRGVTTSIAALSTALSANAAAPAPAGLTTLLSSTALAGSTFSTSTAIAAAKTLTMTALQKTIVGAALVAAVGSGVYEAHLNARLRTRIQNLQQQQTSLTTVVGKLRREHQSTERQLAELRDFQPTVYTNAPVAASSEADTNTIPSDAVIAEIQRALAEPMWGGGRDAAFKRLKKGIALADIPRALAFLVQQPNQSGVNTPLFDDLALRWGSKDPNAAAQWADSLQDTNVEDRAFVDVLRGWGWTSHVDAANYAAQLPAGNLQTDALKNILNGWAFNDVRAAAKWVSQNPQFADDGIGPIFFWGGPGECPDELANMLDAIGSPSLFQKYGEEVGAAWLKSDKWAAREWIQRAPLSDAVKQKLLNRS